MREFLERTIREAGQIVKDALATCRTGNLSYKATNKDVVTETDKRVEQYLFERLRAAYPSFSFLGEETGLTPAERPSDYCWVIDPIDGTAAYEHGQLFYCVSIGLERNGEPVAGAVFAPALDELYCAEQGKGAFLNRKPIRVSERDSLIECAGITGFACTRLNREKNNLATFSAMAPRVRTLLRYGSAALDFCSVAAGRVDFEWEFPLQKYDISAGVIIAREAGATVTDFDGGSNFPERGVLCSNGRIHETVRRLILETDYR